MKNYLRTNKNPIATMVALVMLSVFFILAYQDQFHSYLRFSDGAKFADSARNMYFGFGYISSFNFFDANLLNSPASSLFGSNAIPPLMAYSILASFYAFGVSDFSVILVSSIYYVSSVVITYLIGKRLFGNIAGTLAAITVMANLNFLDYATSGASEMLFTFLVLLTSYIWMVKKNNFIIYTLPLFLLMYLTRPQAIVFIFGFIIIQISRKFGIIKSLIAGLLLGTCLVALDRLVIYPLSYRYGFMPILERGIQAIKAHGVSESPSDALRGAAYGEVSGLNILKKLFYNLYNFYRSFPSIASPYLGALFAISLFMKEKTHDVKLLKLYALLVFAASLIVAALTIPFYRYIHPALPLVYIFAVGAVCRIIGDQFSDKKKVFALIIIFLVLVFSVGQTIGVLFLDKRFKQNDYNLHLPPGYVLLSREFKNAFPDSGLVLTNLDTWLSWYGETESMWLPLRPDMLLRNDEAYDGFETIFLTNYLAEDKNYRLEEGWRKLLEEPESVSELEIGKHFKYVGRIDINDRQVYENKKYYGVVFVKNK